MEVVLSRSKKICPTCGQQNPGKHQKFQGEINYQGILLSESSSTIWAVAYGEGKEGIKNLHLTELEFPLEVEAKLGAAFRLANVCRGLVCALVSGDSIVLWNPYLEDYKRIPTSTLPLLSDENLDDIFGIGYDSIMDDYKIVRFPSITCDSENSPRNRVEVFSLSTNSWKTIQDSSDNFPYLVLQHRRATTVNGRPHWAEDKNILYFDAVQECLGEMRWPETRTEVEQDSLLAFHGWLGVYAFEMYTHHELWVMKEYGLKESWTRLLRIPAMTVPGSPHVFRTMQPICCSKDGKVVLKEEDGGYFLYNPENGKYKKFNIPHEITCLFRETPFGQSLVSPNRVYPLKSRRSQAGRIAAGQVYHQSTVCSSLSMFPYCCIG